MFKQHQIIPNESLPLPRLELRWNEDKEGITGKQYVCSYYLVVPANRPGDVRKEWANYNKEEKSFSYILSDTACNDSSGLIYDDNIMLPKLDKMHSLWDSESIGSLALPVYVTWQDKAQLLTLIDPENKQVHLVWNEQRTEGFFTTDKQLAYEARKSSDTNCCDENGNQSKLAVAFCDIHGEGNCETQVLNIQIVK